MSADLQQRRDQDSAIWAVESYPSVQARLDEMNKRWPSYWASVGIEPSSLAVNRICIVGCNRGGHEWQAAQQWPHAVIDAVDLIDPPDEPPAWRLAQDRFPDRIHYWRGINVQMTLPSTYDLIVATSVIHHCDAPELAAGVIHDHLVPGGHLFIEEYVGAPGLSGSELRYRVAQRLWDSLPETCRMRQPTLYRPDRYAARGLEAYASDQIETSFRSRFELIAERHAHPLTAYRMVNWFESRGPELDPNLHRLLLAFEEVLMSEGWLEGEDWTALLRRKAT